MNRREIPGFWYDEKKNRYFKIEERGPAEAPWSAQNVKRRKLERQEDERAAKLLAGERGRVKRSRVGDDALASAFVLRELGQAPRDTGAACWVRGLRPKGRVELWPGTSMLAQNVPLFYVGGHDAKTGLGVAYASLDESTLTGMYIPRNADDSIDLKNAAEQYSCVSFSPMTEAIRCPQMSSLKYHQPSHKILLTSRKPGVVVGVSLFSPLESAPDDRRPQWLLGEADVYQRLTIPAYHSPCVANSCTPGPAMSPLVCVVGTSSGIAQLHRDGRLSWAGPAPSQTQQQYRHQQRTTRDVLSLDFRAAHPDLVFAGGRSGHLWMVDLRTPAREWEWIRHDSAVAHVRSVNEHQVLAAGPRSSMAVYDVRFRRREGGGSGGGAAGGGAGEGKPDNRPLLVFSDYRNESYMHIGLDVEPTYGIVAAAHDNGKVALFSLRSGTRLRSRAVDQVASHGVIRSLMFQTLPGDRHPSLFAGIGPHIVKYSFGVERDESGALEE